MMRAKALIVLGVAMVGSLHANVVYQFTGILGSVSGVVAGAFTLTLPTTLKGTGATGSAPDLTFFPGPNLVCNCDHIDFFSNAVAHDFAPFPSDAFGFEQIGRIVENLIYFAPGDVTTDGVYNSILTPSDTLTVSGVPEPGSFLPLGLGLGGLALLVARRNRRHNMGRVYTLR